MNTAYTALRLYGEGNRFLRIEGKITLDVGKLDPALLQRTIGAVKRGFDTATQGPTYKLLALVARLTGYNEHGYPYVNHGSVVMYFPRAAASEFKDVSDQIETLMNLDGIALYRAYRYEDHLMFRNRANMNREQRTRLRKFIKDQAARWAIYRQPMLDFLTDPTRRIVWAFDSEYKGDNDGGQ